MIVCACVCVWLGMCVSVFGWLGDWVGEWFFCVYVCVYACVC